MTWWEILRRALELFKALLQKLNKKEPSDAVRHADSKVPGHITRATVDTQVKHQRELYKKNHPKG